MAAYTNVNISNNTDKFLQRGDHVHDVKDWFGSGERSMIIEAQADGFFKHLIDPHNHGGSVGGNAYIFPDKFKWIFAWCTTATKNTVYTDIKDVDYEINWEHILHELRHTSTEKASKTQYGFKSTVTIDSTGPTPNLTATLDEA